MANAAILKDLSVVDITNLTNLKFDLEGFLVQLTLQGVTYRHTETREFREEDLQDKTKNTSGGYYPEADFLKYLAKDAQTTYEVIKNKALTKNPGLKLAKKDDAIKVYRLWIEEPYDFFYKVVSYTIVYNGVPTSLFNDKFEIIVPTAGHSTPQLITNLSNQAREFYLARKVLISLFSANEQHSAALIFTKIALAINMINRDIFPLFNIVGSEGLAEFATNQNNEWKTGDIFNDLSLTNLTNFYNRLINYYKAAYVNSLKIADASGLEKLYWLALSLSPATLSVLPVTEKVKLLKFVSINYLSKITEKEVQENLIVNIALSFNSSNITEVDDFLDLLIAQGSDINSNTTLYQELYEKLSTSTNIKEGLIGVTNWVFNTQFKPTKTKEQFVQAVYGLWQFSKYNPYNNNGTLKPNKIGFKNLNSSLVSFTPTGNQSFLFSYSHLPSFDSIPFATSPGYTGPPRYTYKKIRNNAAPIVMPYESNKFIGIYFDNFSFQFKGSKIIAYQNGLEADYYYGTLNDDDPDQLFPMPVYTELEYGVYDIFQPVTLINSNVETKTVLSTVRGDNISFDGLEVNSLIPVFVLEFIDAAGDRSDAETVIGYTIDAVSTFTGAGVLSKLKHLRWGATAAAGADAIGILTADGIRIVVGGVEFTSGVLGFFANFVECGPNDSFCNAVKLFIASLQIASLTVNAADSLASLAMKRQASEVIEAAGGGANEAAIIENVKSKLSVLFPTEQPSLLQEVTATIVNTQKKYLFTGGTLMSIIEAVKKVAKYRKVTIQLEYTDDVMRNYISFCRNELKITDDIVIEDLLVIANRSSEKKYITPAQLTIQTKYYINEVLKRGFSAGFTNQNDYVLFCNSFRNFFVDTLNNFDVQFFDLENKFDFYIKGSAIRSWTDGDPNINNVILPSRPADDLDIDIMVSDNDYRRFCKSMESYINKLRSENIISAGLRDDLSRKLNPNGDMITYYDFFSNLPIGDSDFTSQLINSCFSYTSFPPNKITFAITKRSQIIQKKRKIINGKLLGRYDTKPKLPFKY